MGRRIKDRETSIYVIDQNFRIVYFNDKLKKNRDAFEYGQLCYEAISGEPQQCIKCPLREENQGESLIFSNLHEEWSNVNAAPIEWPGVDGQCYIIMSESVENNSKSLFYNAVGNSDYDELLELNYLEDSYTIIHHAEQTSKSIKSTGSISETVRSTAERMIHPDDRKKFRDFWLLDRVGKAGVPEEMLATYHGEFRKLMPNGNYIWIQQILMPTKQITENKIFVMSFYNVIGSKNQWEEYFYSALKKIWDKGIDNRQNFFTNTQQILRNSSDDMQWCIISIDIEGLKLFNEWHGRAAGDELLIGVAECLESLQDGENAIAGYFGNDDFALLIEYDKKKIEKLYQDIIELLRSYNKTGFLPAFGVYRIQNKTEHVFTMYDRAELARASIKGNYTVRIKDFNDGMLEKLESKYVLFSDVQKALANNEFTFYLQPKCNLENGKVVGAEALVRWISKEKGLISPGVFIPFLENSGFIAELDTYIWEEVCKWQRSVIDRGIKPIPVSVNVSKVDMYALDVSGFFADLIKKYELPPELIEVEITESTYTEDYVFINKVIDGLRKSGFRVLMDDFGSGYSSLNMLKDIEVDVLKIDMRFLNIDGENRDKGIGIIETVYNMARLMGIGVVVEGVETEEQKSFLLQMGCGYGQGYYFYRPLPIRDFEQVIKDENNRDEERFHNDRSSVFEPSDLLNENMFNEILLNNILGPVAFYETDGQQIKVTKCNDNYLNLVGGKVLDYEANLNPLLHIDRDYHKDTFKLLDEARKNRYAGSSGDLFGYKADGTPTWMHIRLFFLREQDGHAFYYGALSDVSDIHEKNETLMNQNKVLQFLNEDMPGGYYRHKYNDDCDLIYISERFLEIFGYTREEIKEEFDDKFVNMVHPEDRDLLYGGLDALDENGGNYIQPYRMRSKNGYIMVLDHSRQVTYDGEEFFQGLILCDLPSYRGLANSGSDKLEEDIMKWMPCGVFKSEVDGDHAFGYVSDSMLSMLGYSRESFEEKYKGCVENLIYKEDLERVNEEIGEQIQRSNYTACEYRIEMADGSLRWVYSYGRVVTDDDGKRWFYVCITDYDFLKNQYNDKERKQMKYQTLAAIQGSFVYDYVPQFDVLTVEFSLRDGKLETLVVENFLRDLDKNPNLMLENIEEHRNAFETAIFRPMCGELELKVRFPGTSEFYWYRSRYTSFADEHGKVNYVVGRANNIEEEKQAISDWKDRAMRDSMTELLNNKAAKDMISLAIQQYKSGVMILMDLDNFKGINDMLGHLQGDRLLKNVADVIRGIFRADDILARYGGDEFLIFMPGKLNRTLVENRANSLLEKVREIELAGNMQARCSVGIVMCEDGSMSMNMLIHRADIALYQSKRNGKNRYTFYED